MQQLKKTKKPLAENAIRRQLDSFIPEVIIGLVGIASLFLMVFYFGRARVFLTGETIFGVYGMLIHLIIFDVCYGLCLFGGVCDLIIYAVSFKKDKNKIPHQISLALSIIFITVALTLGIFIFILNK